MTTTRTRCVLVLLFLSAIGFGPVSLTALIGMAIVVGRPAWFLRVVLDVYRGSCQLPPITSRQHPKPALGARVRTFMTLAALMILDIAPFPVVGSFGLGIATFRPAWFLRLVAKIYGVG